MRIEIDVEMPEGYEATGEYRPAKAGEHWLDDGIARYDATLGRYIILSPKKRKVIKFVEDANGSYFQDSTDLGFYISLNPVTGRPRYTRIETTE